MTFLNPLALFGLLAAAIPILLHLLNLRRLRTIEFSTLSFLKELQKSSIRRLKLRQLLLLILRTLLVLLIVFAFARPTLRGSLIGNIGSHTRTTAVFIIDDSFSMTVSDDQGELLKQAKQAANNVVHVFKEGDEIFVLPLSSLTGPQGTNENAIRDFSLLAKSLNEIKSSAQRGSLEDGIRVAARMLAGTRNFNKEVYVFSDFQQGVIRNELVGSAAKEKLFAPEVRFFLVPLGKREIQNFGIESVAIPSSIFEKDKPFTVQARVGNYSGNNVQDHVVSVFLNGTRVAERSIDIPQRSVLPLEFSVAASATGYIEGFVETEEDDFQYDNRRYFVLKIPERIRALVVGGAGETRFPLLALSTRTSASESALVLNEVTADRMSSVEIKRADVIVLCTSVGFSAGQVSELSAFVRSGGGLVLFPGTGIDPVTFNALMGAGLSIPSLTGIDRPSKPTAESGSYLEFGKVELQHPLFEGMFESRRGQPPAGSSAGGSAAAIRMESPRVRTSARFALTPQSNPVIALTNGAPFLAEQRLGTGRIFLFAVPPTTDWSDLPLKGIFVPLLHRSVLYLARAQARPEEALPGSEVVVRSSVATSGTWTIRNPQKVDVVATPTLQAFQQSLRFSGTDQPGIYTVLAKKEKLEQFVVNLDSRESQTQKATTAEISSLLDALGIDRSAVRESSNSDTIGRTVLESRFGVELWKYLLILALIVAVIELLVARSTRQETGPA
ncbi:MAG: VWA domain-containing protein [Ignavibacteriales bacterium]|nr:VWA domain-containing protein [Ignavibacteriales bacterium]